MSPVLWCLAGLGTLALFIVAKVATDLVNKEIQGWLPEMCFFLLRLARRRMPPELRKTLFDGLGLEDELRTVLFHTYEGRPITAFVKGFRFSLSYLLKVRKCVTAVTRAPRRPRLLLYGHRYRKFVLRISPLVFLGGFAVAQMDRQLPFLSVFMEVVSIVGMVAWSCLVAVRGARIILSRLDRNRGDS